MSHILGQIFFIQSIPNVSETGNEFFISDQFCIVSSVLKILYFFCIYVVVKDALKYDKYIAIKALSMFIIDALK